MEVNVPYHITRELRLRGLDVFTAQEDGSGELEIGKLLTRASALGRVLFTRDDDLLREATRRQRPLKHLSVSFSPGKLTSRSDSASTIWNSSPRPRTRKSG